jgi:ABC-type phosphate transport system substrate-binding protein
VDPVTSSGTAVTGYTYNTFAGNRTFLRDYVGITIPALGYQGQTVADDIEMVEKVAGDPYGIGYCSSVFADPDKVKILDIVSGGAAHHFPNSNKQYNSTFSPGYGTSCDYPLWRVVKAEYITTNTTDSYKFAQIMNDANFRLCPLFNTGYWLSL